MLRIILMTTAILMIVGSSLLAQAAVAQPNIVTKSSFSHHTIPTSHDTTRFNGLALVEPECPFMWATLTFQTTASDPDWSFQRGYPIVFVQPSQYEAQIDVIDSANFDDASENGAGIATRLAIANIGGSTRVNADEIIAQLPANQMPGAQLDWSHQSEGWLDLVSGDCGGVLEGSTRIICRELGVDSGTVLQVAHSTETSSAGRLNVRLSKSFGFLYEVTYEEQNGFYSAIQGGDYGHGTASRRPLNTVAVKTIAQAAAEGHANGSFFFPARVQGFCAGAVGYRLRLSD